MLSFLPGNVFTMYVCTSVRMQGFIQGFFFFAWEEGGGGGGISVILLLPLKH